MKTGRSRMEAIKQALYSIGSIYEAIREGHFSPYYGKKIATRYWEKLDLSESEILRYFGGVAGSEAHERDSSITELDWLLRGRKAECLSAVRYFEFIGQQQKPVKSKTSKEKAK